jgi:hypothetical protein
MPSPAILRLDVGIHNNNPQVPSRTVSNANVATDPAHLGSGVGSGLTGVEASKQLAAWTAVDRHLKPEHRVSRRSLPDLPNSKGGYGLLRSHRLWALAPVSIYITGGSYPGIHEHFRLYCAVCRATHNSAGS